MSGWIVAAVLYGFGTLVVFKLSNDPIHRMMAPIWPITVLRLIFFR